MAFFSIKNNLSFFNVTLSNISRLNKFSFSDKKTLIKKILYEDKPQRVELGVYKSSLNYTYNQPLRPTRPKHTVDLNNTVQRINTMQCNTIYANVSPFSTLDIHSNVLKRADIIQSNNVQQKCETIRQCYTVDTQREMKGEQEEFLQQSEAVQQSEAIKDDDAIENWNKREECESIQLYNFTKQIVLKKNPRCQFYILVPLNNLYINQVKALQVKNISVITSVSDTFLQKFTNRTLESTKKMLTRTFDKECGFANVKLYVTCLAYCQFEGPQKINKIVQDVLYYNAIPGISEICLADTFGALNYTEFQQIIDGLANTMDCNKLSVRLAMKQTYCIKHSIEQEYNLISIIQYCIQNNIYQFDVISPANDNIEFANTCKIVNYRKLYDLLKDYKEDFAELAYYA